MKEKEYLDSLIKEFIEIIRFYDEKAKNGTIDPNELMEKEKFEEEFVRLNCYIQQIRSDNETLIDELRNKEDVNRKMESEIQQKKKIIDNLQEKIKNLK